MAVSEKTKINALNDATRLFFFNNIKEDGASVYRNLTKTYKLMNKYINDCLKDLCVGERIAFVSQIYAHAIENNGVITGDSIKVINLNLHKYKDYGNVNKLTSKELAEFNTNRIEKNNNFTNQGNGNSLQEENQAGN